MSLTNKLVAGFRNSLQDSSQHSSGSYFNISTEMRVAPEAKFASIITQGKQEIK
jgi:hypothetical protein